MGHLTLSLQGLQSLVKEDRKNVKPEMGWSAVEHCLLGVSCLLHSGALQRLVQDGAHQHPITEREEAHAVQPSLTIYRS